MALLLARVSAASVHDTGLADLSLEQLSALQVTTTALRPERLSEAAASVFVITQEDIRRSGATSLEEALRLAPNLQVARVNADTYAISARGFQNVINNKLLVLIDGRTIYTTVLSGVLWDAQDVMLEDVDRIEVVSGPGGALFGANAFSGVVNVITRSAAASQGLVATAEGGNTGADAAMRFGGKIGRIGAYRVYVMHIDHDSTTRRSGTEAADRARKEQVGFRMDLGSPESSMTLQGDAYNATTQGGFAPKSRLAGANLIGTVRRRLDDGSDVQLQTYWDHTDRDDPIGFKDYVDQLDITLQDDLPAHGRHRLSIGAGYRYIFDRTTPNAVLRFIPENRRLHWANAFAQDRIELSRAVTLTLGAKIQTEVYVKAQFLPDARLAWKPTPRQLLWTAASRVSRPPGRVDKDFNVPGNPPFIIRGSPIAREEIGDVYEWGYRADPSPTVSASATLFYQKLDYLRSGTPAPGGGFYVANEIAGNSTGLEAWGTWQAAPSWRLSAGLLELNPNLRLKPGSLDPTGPSALGNDPRHTVKLRSSWRLSEAIDLDLQWRYVSALSFSTVPAYNAADVRVAWRLSPSMEVALVGSDLFQRGHVEFDDSGNPSMIPRSAYLQLRWTPR